MYSKRDCAIAYRSCKLQFVHHICQHAKEDRFDFLMMMCEKMDEDNDCMKKSVFSNEATIHISGRVNKHNCRILCSCLPNEYLEHERDSLKVNM